MLSKYMKAKIGLGIEKIDNHLTEIVKFEMNIFSVEVEKTVDF